MNDQITGIVIVYREYRENDALLHILAEDGVVYSLIARGIQKIKSKNAPACQLFSKSRFLFNKQETSDLHSLRSAEIVDSYRRIREDLYKQSIASYLCDCLYNSEFEEDVYALLDDSLQVLKETTHPLRILCLFQAIVNRMHGIEPYVDGCVRCGSKNNIQAISSQGGGFVCQMCYQRTQDTKKTGVELKRFRLLCKAQLQHYELLCAYNDFTFSDFLSLHEFFAEYAGVRVKSIRFLKHLYSMEEDL